MDERWELLCVYVVSKRGCHGCFLPMVHFVRPVLAHRAAGTGDLPVRLARHSAFPHFRYRGPRSIRSHQRVFLLAGAAASRTACYLTALPLVIDELQSKQSEISLLLHSAPLGIGENLLL